jgi:hypothetical protein
MEVHKMLSTLAQADYLEKFGAVFEDRRYAGGVNLQLPPDKFDHGYTFNHLDRHQLRAAVSQAMSVAVPYYIANISRRTGDLNMDQIEECALEVVLRRIRIWDGNRVGPRIFWSRRLFKPPENLTDFQAREVILLYCKKKYGDDYARHCACLLDSSTEDFLKWEQKRERFYSLW